MASSYRDRERFLGDADYLIHFGIIGQKWGVRRYQNEDGSLTEEGKRRYLGLSNDNYNNVEKIYNKVVDRANSDLSRINKKYDKADLDDDRTNLEYTREVRDAWQKHFRDVLAEDIGTDPSTLNGQEWLSEVFGYRTNFDSEIEDLEKKLKASEKKEKSNAKSSGSVSAKTKNAKSSSGEKYGNKKMSQEEAFNILNRDLEKMYGEDFWDLPEDKQNDLMIEYANESGLYKWM